MPRTAKTTQPTHVAPAKPPLPKGWQWMRFDQIAINVSDRIDDPKKAGVEHYVGLEHLDSDSLKIRRWGTPDDVEAQKLRFQPGDIIFGKRRAYQRKVGVAEFAGICSAHAFVFRGNPKHIVPELLPYFMQTDAFMERAVAISKGSLSPTINWGDLARQEFALPSDPAEQRRIADLLAAADEAVEGWQAAKITADQMRRTALGSVLDLVTSKGSKVEVLRIGEAGSVQLGRQRSPVYDTGRYKKPYLRVANVFDGHLDLSDVMEMDFDARDFETFQLRNGDILLNEGQSRELVGRSCIYRDEIKDCCFQNTLIRFRCSDRVIPEYAQAYFQWMFYRGDFAKVASQTTSIAHLGSERFASLSMRLPSVDTQREIIREIEAVETIQKQASARTEQSRDVYRKLSALLFTPSTEPT